MSGALYSLIKSGEKEGRYKVVRSGSSRKKTGLGWKVVNKNYIDKKKLEKYNKNMHKIMSAKHYKYKYKKNIEIKNYLSHRKPQLNIRSYWLDKYWCKYFSNSIN